MFSNRALHTACVLPFFVNVWSSTLTEIGEIISAKHYALEHMIGTLHILFIIDPSDVRVLSDSRSDLAIHRTSCGPIKYRKVGETVRKFLKFINVLSCTSTFFYSEN